jgi:glycosyltransferase involved in cell wall biosynthesis
MHFTICIPTFNRAYIIDKTIECVLAQTYKDYDLIIVDDGSTDNTDEIVKKYLISDPSLRFFKNEKNLGLTKNWNRCIELTQGPAILLLLSDDLIDENYLELVNKKMEENTEIGIVASSCRYINIKGEIISEGRTFESQHFKAGDEAVMAFLKNGFPHVSSIVVKKECYEKLGNFDERIWHGPDVEMDARIASQYDYYFFGEPHTSFRRHGSNMVTLEYLRKDFLEIDILKKKLAYGYLSENGRKELGIRDLEKYVNSNASKAALTGSIAMIAYGKYLLGRYYLSRSLALNKKTIFSFLFIKTLALNLFPVIGEKIMKKRMKMLEIDQQMKRDVEKSLNSI